MGTPALLWFGFLSHEQPLCWRGPLGHFVSPELIVALGQPWSHWCLLQFVAGSVSRGQCVIFMLLMPVFHLFAVFQGSPGPPGPPGPQGAPGPKVSPTSATHMMFPSERHGS